MKNTGEGAGEGQYYLPDHLFVPAVASNRVRSELLRFMLWANHERRRTEAQHYATFHDQDATDMYITLARLNIDKNVVVEQPPRPREVDDPRFGSGAKFSLSSHGVCYSPKPDTDKEDLVRWLFVALCPMPEPGGGSTAPTVQASKAWNAVLRCRPRIQGLLGLLGLPFAHVFIRYDNWITVVRMEYDEAYFFHLVPQLCTFRKAYVVARDLKRRGRLDEGETGVRLVRSAELETVPLV